MIIALDLNISIVISRLMIEISQSKYYDRNLSTICFELDFLELKKTYFFKYCIFYLFEKEFNFICCFNS